MMDWVRNHFFPLLEQRLPDCLPIEHETKIFIDVKTVETGSAWPSVLRSGLENSRCLVAVLSPEYFRSPWCLAEWKSMVERHRVLGLATDDNPRSLIYPVRFADGEHFPPEARILQPRDLRKWNSPFPMFSETREFLDLDQQIQQMCGELAAMIAKAPAWQKWPIVTPPAPSMPVIGLPRYR
jgi:hypothetical protein